MKPLAIDLFCGLGGWTEGLLSEGWDVIGFDIEAHHYGDQKYPAQLVLQDVRSIHGSQFKDADLIVGSSPCQEFSYRAMPWKRAKALPPPYLGMELFNAQFRIQREACEAAGRHIPMVVENVRGAQKWVGRSRWNFGSFHLWGDVPALMPMTRALPKNAGHLNQRDGHSHTPHLTNPQEHRRDHGRCETYGEPCGYPGCNFPLCTEADRASQNPVNGIAVAERERERERRKARAAVGSARTRTATAAGPAARARHARRHPQ